MLHHVGEGLGDEKIGRGLDLGREASFGGRSQLDGDGGPLRERPERGAQSVLREDRRMDPARELAELGQRPGELLLGGVEPRRELDVAARIGASASHPQVQGQGHEPLLRAVVQVAFEPPPRLVLRGDQPLA
jgi:hypothetical protein